MAAKLRTEGIPTFCSDPQSFAHRVEPGVTYLPEGLDWSNGSGYVAKHWLTMEAPWCCEGVGVVRAIRKLVGAGHAGVLKGVEIIFLDHPHETLTLGQAAMHKAVTTMWHQVKDKLLQ